MQHFLFVETNIPSAGYALFQSNSERVQQDICDIHLEVTIRANEEIKLISENSGRRTRSGPHLCETANCQMKVFRQEQHPFLELCKKFFLAKYMVPPADDAPTTCKITLRGYYKEVADTLDFLRARFDQQFLRSCTKKKPSKAAFAFTVS